MIKRLFLLMLCCFVTIAVYPDNDTLSITKKYFTTSDTVIARTIDIPDYDSIVWKYAIADDVFKILESQTSFQYSFYENKQSLKLFDFADSLTLRLQCVYYKTPTDSISSNKVYIRILLPLEKPTIEFKTDTLCPGLDIDLKVKMNLPSLTLTDSITYQLEKSIDNISFVFDVDTVTTFESNDIKFIRTVDSTNFYRVKVMADFDTVYSDTARVNVYEKLTISKTLDKQPYYTHDLPKDYTPIIDIRGGKEPHTYEWQEKTIDGSFKPIPDATNSTLKIPEGFLSKTVRLQVKDACNQIEYTNEIEISILLANITAPRIKSSTTDTLCYGKDRVELTILEEPFGCDGNKPEYQWKKSHNESDFTSILDATNNVLIVDSLDTTTWYRLDATLCETTVSSLPLKVEVYSKLEAGKITGGPEIKQEDLPFTIKLSEQPKGGRKPYNYKWKIFSADGNPLEFRDNNTNSLEITDSYPPDFDVQLVIFDNCNDTVQTNILRIKIVEPEKTPPVIEVEKIDTLCNNDEASHLKLVKKASGNTIDRYVWKRSEDGIKYDSVAVLIEGDSVYKPGRLLRKTWFKITAKSVGGDSIDSDPIVINVYEQFTSGKLSPDDEICYNSSPQQPLKLIEKPSGGSGKYSYQWLNSKDNKTFKPIEGATDTILYTGLLTETTFYRMKISDTYCNTIDTTNTVTIAVREQLNAGIITGDTVICFNAKPERIEFSMKPSGGTSKYRYQWKSSVDNDVFRNIPGANDSVYQPGNLTETTYYRLRVIDDCDSIETNVVLITVAQELQIELKSELNNSVCFNTAPSTSFEAETIGGKGEKELQWESSEFKDKDFKYIEGATSLIYTHTEPLLKTTYFRLKVQDDCSSNIYSKVFTVKVNALPDSLFIKGDTCVCSDQLVEYTLINAPNPDIVFEWRLSKGGTLNTQSKDRETIEVLWNNVISDSKDTITLHQVNNITGCELIQHFPIALLKYKSPDITKIIRKGNSNILIRQDGKAEKEILAQDVNATIHYFWGYTSLSSGVSDTLYHYNKNSRYIDFAAETGQILGIVPDYEYWVIATLEYKNVSNNLIPIQCPSTSSYSLTSSEQSMPSQMLLSIYPNPTNGDFNVSSVFDEPNTIDFRIFSATGELIYQKLLTDIIDMNENIKLNLQKGVYLIQVIDNKGVNSNRLIVK